MIITVMAKTGEPITLGREGENLARRIKFDLTRWEKLYGPGVAQLIAQRTGETTPYPVKLTLDGSNAIWYVTAADTAIHGMSGKAELRYYVGETLAKSETWRTIVLDALGEPSAETPEPQKSWVDQVLDAANRAEDAAKRAEGATGGGSVSILDALPEATEDQRGKFTIVPQANTDTLYICMLVDGIPLWVPLNGSSADSEPGVSDTTSVLGTAVLGAMILGG